MVNYHEYSIFTKGDKALHYLTNSYSALTMREKKKKEWNTHGSYSEGSYAFVGCGN